MLHVGWPHGFPAEGVYKPHSERSKIISRFKEEFRSCSSSIQHLAATMTGLSSATLSLTLILSVIAIGAHGSSRNDRVWPLSNSDSVDLGQSSPFGPRLKASQRFR